MRRRNVSSSAVKRSGASTQLTCPTPGRMTMRAVGIALQRASATVSGCANIVLTVENDGRHVDVTEHVAQIGLR